MFLYIFHLFCFTTFNFFFFFLIENISNFLFCDLQYFTTVDLHVHYVVAHGNHSQVTTMHSHILDLVLLAMDVLALVQTVLRLHHQDLVLHFVTKLPLIVVHAVLDIQFLPQPQLGQHKHATQIRVHQHKLQIVIKQLQILFLVRWIFFLKFI